MKIVVASQQVGHYTGGRYYCFMLCCALGELGHDVTLCVDRKTLPFEHDFVDYARPRVAVTGLGNYTSLPKADFYIGLPVTGAEQACWAARYANAPAAVCILDVLPLMKEHRGGRCLAMHEAFWVPMLDAARRTGAHLFVLANHNVAPAAKWTGIPKNRIHVVYPAVNHRVAAKAYKDERGSSVCFISRIEGHKRLPHVLDAVKPLNLTLDIVTARSDRMMIQQRSMADKVRWYVRVPDLEKFQILSRAQAMINASVWEGFGMFLIEALATGTPAVLYSFPTFHEVVDGSPYEDYVYFAKRGDRNDLHRKLLRCLMDNRVDFPPDKRFTMNRMMKQLSQVLAKIV
jgi:glycosyltransferase involved in cell wall biosynthesis